MLPASFWPQTLAVRSNENKQIETVRNARGTSIGFLLPEELKTWPVELDFGSVTPIRSECNDFACDYFPAGICEKRDSDANPPFTRAERFSYWSLAIKSTPARIAARQRNDAFSREPKLYPLSHPFTLKSRSRSPFRV